jgi:hypothetical protein
VMHVYNHKHLITSASNTWFKFTLILNYPCF